MKRVSPILSKCHFPACHCDACCCVRDGQALQGTSSHHQQTQGLDKKPVLRCCFRPGPACTPSDHDCLLSCRTYWWFRLGEDGIDSLSSTSPNVMSAE